MSDMDHLDLMRQLELAGRIAPQASVNKEPVYYTRRELNEERENVINQMLDFIEKHEKETHPLDYNRSALLSILRKEVESMR